MDDGWIRWVDGWMDEWMDGRVLFVKGIFYSNDVTVIMILLMLNVMICINYELTSIVRNCNFLSCIMNVFNVYLYDPVLVLDK